MLLVEHGGCVGLFEVAPEFCECFCERYSHGYCQSRLFFDEFAKGVCNRYAVAEKFFRTRHVKPTFVYAETFDSVGKARVDLKNLFRVFDVFVKMRKNEHYIGAFLLCRPQSFARLNACFFGKLVFCEHDSVSCFGISAYGKRHPVVFGMQFLFHRCVEVV